MRIAILLMSGLISARASARVGEDQTVRDRPLVIDDGELDLYGGLRLFVGTEPEVELSDNLHLPLGASYGLGHNLEVGLQIDIDSAAPDFVAAFTPRARLAVGDARRLAVGLAMTLPLGFATHHLGPRGVPVRLELPAFRYESTAGAVQATLGWSWVLQEGSDAKALDAGLAGIVGIGSSTFLVADAAFEVLDRVAGTEAALGVGAAFGWEITRSAIMKVHVFTSDIIEATDVQFLALFVYRLRARVGGPDDWL